MAAILKDEGHAANLAAVQPARLTFGVMASV